MSNHRTCCCKGEPCVPGFRFVQVVPQMFPSKFMAHSGEFAPPEVSFWVRYLGSCEKTEPKDADIVIQQTFGDSDEERVIRIGDTETKFMSDLGPTLPTSPAQVTRIGMTRPGDNKTVAPSYFLGQAFSGSTDPKMLGTPAIGNIDKSIAMTLWHRNCFKLKDAEFLTEEEWLARDDYRVVFRSSGFAPSVETIRQIDVHIFTDQEPFQELDLIPNEYSPALHCIPNKTVGGFVFDSGDPDQYFILYDYKDYYPDQVGLVLAEGSYDSVVTSISGCDTATCPSGTVPSRQYLAYRTLKPLPPGSQFPFQPEARLTCPNQGWDAPINDPTQSFPASSGVSCDDQPSGEPECDSEELCHGSQTLPNYVGFGSMGERDVFGFTARTVEENHPYRNRLFVQGIWFDVEALDPLEHAYSFIISEVGTDDFEGSDYVTFSGTAALRIEQSNSVRGGLDFGTGYPFGVDLDPNPPSDPDPATGPAPFLWSANTNVELGPPWLCDCDQANAILVNNERIDSLCDFGSRQTYESGVWKHKTYGWIEPTFPDLYGNFLSSAGGTPRTIGQPQLNFPIV
jgi:hypothetical protein